MPEGHTLHALAGRLDRAFAGAPVTVTSPQGRFAAGAALLDGSVLREASAWGKHLFAEFDGDAWLHVHLGLIGKFDVVDDPRAPVRGQVRLRLANRHTVADLRGPQLCAVVTPDQVTAVQDRLGPDPLRPDAAPDGGAAAVARSRRTVAELLMDQSVLAGVGNVYRCEVLFRHRIDPFRPGRELRPSTWPALWQDLVTLMPLGVAAGQILTMTDQVEDALAELAATGAVTTPERRYHVYKRTGEPCRVCGSKIRTAVVAGRNLFWCGRCQRRR
ncbi:MAG TPA: DNA-formamidopyrimidine glycosylase family protein [Candidatus Nanopelagicales bacterium]|jgi:endonuclease-8|nr:DNA-formamidopyrimidine glycosylase family protein [Candidatus Nanopelagicales bacterium]